MIKPVEVGIPETKVSESIHGAKSEYLDDDDHQCAEDEPRYSKLIEAINRFHPRNDKMEKFGICDNLGSYPICCCSKQ